jgi:hypothetical protein
MFIPVASSHGGTGTCVGYTGLVGNSQYYMDDNVIHPLSHDGTHTRSISF